MLSKIKKEFKNIIYGRRFLKYVRGMYRKLYDVVGVILEDEIIGPNLVVGWLRFIVDTSNFDRIEDEDLMRRWWEHKRKVIVETLTLVEEP